MPLVDSLAPRRRSGERQGRGSGGLPRWCCPNAPFDGEFPTFVLRWAAMICYKNSYLWQQSGGFRSEEHTSELQSHSDLVCRLLLEKKKNKITINNTTCYYL